MTTHLGENDMAGEEGSLGFLPANWRILQHHAHSLRFDLLHPRPSCIYPATRGYASRAIHYRVPQMGKWETIEACC